MIDESARFQRARILRRRHVAVTLGLLMMVAQGCASVPDAVNPVEWYKGARDWVSGDDTQAEIKKAEAEAPDIPGEDKPYPSVASVPEAPKRTIAEEREAVAEGLVADRENARYTNEIIRRQSVPGEPARAARSASTAETRPVSSGRNTGGSKPAATRESKAETAVASRTERTEAPKAEPPARMTTAPVESPPKPRQPAVRAETVPVPPRSTPPAPAPARAENQAPPPRATRRQTAQVRAEPVPPPTQTARRAPPPPPNLSSTPAAPTPPPPPATVTRQPVPRPAVPPAPPPVAPPPQAQSQLVFGPPPSDIALLQEADVGSAPAPPRRQAPVPSAPARATPTISAAPDPASLDPASQVAIVTFGQGSSNLSGTARRIIREVADMQRQRGGKLFVIGHSSSWTRDMNPVRHNMINFGLSLDRANSVARELLELGLTPNDLSIGAMSDSRPLFHETMPSGEAGNRRVEIFLEGG